MKLNAYLKSFSHRKCAYSHIRHHVADRDPYLGSEERRPGQRDLEEHRWRGHLEAPNGQRSSHQAIRQGRFGGRTEQPESSLCADRNQRWGTAPRRRGGIGGAVALGGRRKYLARGELRSESRLPPAVLHAHGRVAGQPGRDMSYSAWMVLAALASLLWAAARSTSRRGLGDALNAHALAAGCAALLGRVFFAGLNNAYFAEHPAEPLT